MNTSTIIKKRRLNRKTIEAMTLIDRGNRKLLDSLETLGPSMTTDEFSQVYKAMTKIMKLQCQAYRVILSEKEETWT